MNGGWMATLQPEPWREGVGLTASPTSLIVAGCVHKVSGNKISNVSMLITLRCEWCLQQNYQRPGDQTISNKHENCKLA